MWSACIEVFIGRGLVMTRARGSPLSFSQHSAKSSIADMLSEHPLFNKTKRSWLKRNYRFTLGAGFCKTHPVEMPAGVTRTVEKAMIARAAAEESEGSPAIHCAMDLQTPDLIASVLNSDFEAIITWAAANRGTVISVVPLWSKASLLPASGNHKIKAMIIQETHACTLLSRPTSGPAEVFCIDTGWTDKATHNPAIRRWLTGAGFSTDEILALRFSHEYQPHLSKCRDAWAGHWRAP